MTGAINFTPGAWSQAQGQDATPPIPTTPGTPPAPGSPVDAMYAALVAAANGDDPENDADFARRYEERQGKYDEALGKFPADDAQSASRIGETGQESQLAQSFPQIISAVTGAVTGAVGGIMGPLTQIPQAAGQALQSATGALGSSTGSDTSLDAGEGLDGLDEFSDGLDGFGDGSGSSDGGAGGEGGAGGGGDLTGPTSNLGPPPTPVATFPAAAPVLSQSGSVAPTTPAGPIGPGGVPMMPPMAPGAGGAGGSDKKSAETKKVAPPVIGNGQLVQGRVTPSKLPPMTVSKTSASRQNLQKAPQEEVEK